MTIITKTLRNAALAVAIALPGTAFAAGGGDQKITDYAFSFEGIFGGYDQAQLQRGLKVYHEVCSSCHGLSQVYFRNLAEDHGPGFSAAQIEVFAAEYEVADTAAEALPGDLRSAKLGDQFPGSALANAPDLSLMAKARAGFHGPLGSGISQLVNGMGGAEYIASLLTHYTGSEKLEAGTTLYGNETFSGGYISMAPPLSDGIVTFDDGHANDLESLAIDVSAFLMWTAEPKLAERKQAGFAGVVLLSIFAVLLYLTNKSLWYPIKHRKSEDV